MSQKMAARSPAQDAMSSTFPTTHTNWMSYCLRDGVDSNEMTKIRAQWGVAVVAVLFVLLLHAMRLHKSSYYVRELTATQGSFVR